MKDVPLLGCAQGNWLFAGQVPLAWGGDKAVCLPNASWRKRVRERGTEREGERERERDREREIEREREPP